MSLACALLLLFGLSACTKKAESVANVTIQFGSASASSMASAVNAKSVSSMANGTSAWLIADPTSISQIKCFAIAISGPTADLQSRKCTNLNGDVVLRAGILKGSFAVGSTASIELASGPKRVIQVIGFAATSTASCTTFVDSSSGSGSGSGNPDKANLSAPQIIGSRTIDVVPGANSVSIDVSLNGATKFEDCDGSGTGNGGPTPTPAPTGSMQILAGGYGGPGNLDGDSSLSRFESPSGVAVDASGNTYVADPGSRVIRKITPAGVTSLFAGSPGVSGSVDGVGTAARFNSPYDIGIDLANGDLYVVDIFDYTIRKITSAGAVTTLAGLSGNPGSADGTGSAARFLSPAGIAVDSTNGALYVADRDSHTIRKVTFGGVVTTFAGGVGVSGTTNASGIAARFNGPVGVAYDPSSLSLYVADTGNNMIRKITSVGMASTFAGAITSGVTDATGTAARFAQPNRLVVTGTGFLFVSDTGNNTIRKIDLSTAATTTVAGGAGVPDYIDGLGTAARFKYPVGIALDSSGNIFVTESGNNTIRKVSVSYNVTTLAGRAEQIGSIDGTGTTARFNNASALAVDTALNIYVADSVNHTIRKITAAGVVSTFAGAAGISGATNATGAAARFNFPRDIVVDSAGNLFVADYSNYVIRKITPAGVVTTFAGSGTSGYLDGTGAGAQFGGLSGLAIDTSGNLYAYDGTIIRKITPAGIVTTVAGAYNSPGYADGSGAVARFTAGGAIAVNSSGELYVADVNNAAIRKIAVGGITSTFAGQGGVPGSLDGTGTSARFDGPTGITIDPSGTIYVSESMNNTVRKITSAGVVTTVIGTAGAKGLTPGSLPGTIAFPFGIANQNGSLYFISENSVVKSDKP